MAASRMNSRSLLPNKVYSSVCSASDEAAASTSNIPTTQSGATPKSRASLKVRKNKLKSTKCGKTFGQVNHLEEYHALHFKIKPYSCVLCGKAFAHERNLKRHGLVHSDEKGHWCKTCGKVFKLKEHLNRHLTSYSTQKSFNCETSGKGFARSDYLKVRRAVHTEASFACNGCDRKFNQLASLHRHRLTHSEVFPFSCGECEKIFKSQDILQKHMSRHHKCETCGKGFQRLDHLKAHEAVHKEASIACNICGKKFKHRRSLIRHRPTHSKESPYSCDVCEETFKSEDSLQKHKSRDHEGQIASESSEKDIPDRDNLHRPLLSHSSQKSLSPYSCDVCEETFKTEDSLQKRKSRNHEERMAGEPSEKDIPDRDNLHRPLLSDSPKKSLKCETCGKEFKRPDHLRAHRAIHAEASIACNVCDKKFKQMSCLYRHRLTHSEGSVFSGDVREKIFKSQDSLLKNKMYRPLLSSSTQKSFECKTCSKEFLRLDHLQSHEAVHKEASIACNDCDKTFKHMRSLYRHRLTHSEGSLFSCDLCEETFKTEDSLQKHKSRNHEERMAGEPSEKDSPSRDNLHRPLLSHSPQKSLKCETCGREFKRSDHLRAHRSSHAEASIACNVCDKKFKQMSSLYRHRLTHSEGSLFSCDLCEETFNRKDSLQRHTNRIHKRTKRI